MKKELDSKDDLENENLGENLVDGKIYSYSSITDYSFSSEFDQPVQRYHLPKPVIVYDHYENEIFNSETYRESLVAILIEELQKPDSEISRLVADIKTN